MSISWLLVVIDDRPEFAEFCWRYLTRSIGLSLVGDSEDGNDSEAQRLIRFLRFSPDRVLAVASMDLTVLHHQSSLAVAELSSDKFLPDVREEKEVRGAGSRYPGVPLSRPTLEETPRPETLASAEAQKALEIICRKLLDCPELQREPHVDEPEGPASERSGISVRFLLDLNGPAVVPDWVQSLGEAVEKGRESLEGALPELSGNKVEVTFVSSYPNIEGPSGAGEIEPKSRLFLEQMRSEIYQNIKRPKSRRRDSAHILISGAGFEVRKKGASLEIGVDDTSKLLDEIQFQDPEFELFSFKALRSRKLHGAPFPVPWRFADIDEVVQAARQRDLDTFWDRVIRLALRDKLDLERQHASSRAREEVKRAALITEMRLREGFRRAFLRRDWGFLAQAVDAAQIDWDVWLTTNYTQFADRAVDAVNEARMREEASARHREWQVLSSVSSARAMLEAGKAKSPRLVFKLHGDIRHLHTMAIAGEDKDFISTLPYPVDRLHVVYDAAEAHLKRLLLASRGPQRVEWHIVGHSLWDQKLLGLIDEVSHQIWLRRERMHQVFRIVDPFPQPPLKRLKSALKWLPEAKAASRTAKMKNWLPQFKTFSVSARQYLAGLQITGFEAP